MTGDEDTCPQGRVARSSLFPRENGELFQDGGEDVSDVMMSHKSDLIVSS